MASFCVTRLSLLCAFLAVLLKLSHGQNAGGSYRGRLIGALMSKKHNVSGEVYAVDSRTLHIRSFTYDGTAPDAFFWTGFTDQPSPQGIIIPNERGTKEVLVAYNNQDVTISLPDGLTLRDVKWFAVWCRAYEVNFGDVYIPANLDFPQAHVVGSIVGQHGVSSGPIVVVDAQTILVPDFTYDGQSPDLHFWVGRGVPGPNGIRVPDETGTDAPLQKADKKTMVLSLPGDLTVFDIDYFGVYGRLYSTDFGHVRITPGLNVPPSLRMLGVAPQSKLNCEVLHEESAFELRWSVVESGETIVFQLVGRIDNGKYMGFGLSGDDDRSVMLGGDAIIGWFDQALGRGHVVDYHLGGKSVCQGSSGVCPDVRFKEGANNVRLLSAANVNGFTILTFQRKLRAMDGLDKRIRTNGSQPIIWAIGKMQQDLAGYHEVHSEDFSIDFGRSPKWNCPEPQEEPEFGETKNDFQSTQRPLVTTTTESSKQPDTREEVKAEEPLAHPTAWNVPPIPCDEPDDGVYYVHVGPSGRKDVFKSVTGIESPPENVWYINGLLMPEIYLVRNRNYTFVIQGGENNGFYITSNEIGDFQQNSVKGRREDIFGGVELDSLGNARATAVGKLCRWKETASQRAEFFASYASYQRSLNLDCGKGHSGILHFTPTAKTPNLLYYQSFSKPNMGWKIHILDNCGKGGLQPGGRDQNVGESNTQTVFLQENRVTPVPSPGFLPHSPHPIQHSIQLKELQQQPSSIVPHLPQPQGQYPIKNAFLIDNTMFTNHNQQGLVFKGKMNENIQAQSSMRQPIIAMSPPQGNSFQLTQSPGLYQIAVEGGPPPSMFQVPDNYFQRRTNGPQQFMSPTHPPPPPQPQTNLYKYPNGIPYGEGYYEQPRPVSIMYGPTTMAPVSSRRNGITFMEAHHHDLQMRGRMPSNPPRLIMGENDVRHPPIWVHSRNLPKRESTRRDHFAQVTRGKL